MSNLHREYPIITSVTYYNLPIFLFNMCLCFFCNPQIFSAVLKALKDKIARIALVEELKYYIDNNRAQIEHQQFDLVVRLLNCALQVCQTLIKFRNLVEGKTSFITMKYQLPRTHRGKTIHEKKQGCIIQMEQQIGGLVS